MRYTRIYTASTELCCTSGDPHSQNGIYITSFVLPVLASCTYMILFHPFKVLSGTAPLYLRDMV